MPAHIDREQWSGEGDFTQTLVDWFLRSEKINFLRVEDSTATRADVDYNFISNEIFLEFKTRERIEQGRLWGIFPRRRIINEKLTTLTPLEAELASDPEIAVPDYSDDGMIQFLHTQRIVPPYQTKGYKLVELVRVYEIGTQSHE